MDKLGPLRPLAAAYALAALTLMIPVAAKLAWDIPAGDLLRDCPAVLGGASYTGVISYLGIVLWGGAAMICFFAAAAEPPGEKRHRGFWLYAGALTVLLLVDDLLMLHEVLFPLHLGLSEYVLYGFYALAALFYVVYFRALLLRANYLLLLLAVAWFAASLLVDRFEGTAEMRGILVMEDGAKLFGIVSWLLFHANFALARVRAAHSQRP